MEVTYYVLKILPPGKEKPQRFSHVFPMWFSLLTRRHLFFDHGIYKN